jgi:hypothetical protein
LTLGLIPFAAVIAAPAANAATVTGSASPVRVTFTGSALEAVPYAALNWTTSSTLAATDTVSVTLTTAPSPVAQLAVGLPNQIGTAVTNTSGSITGSAGNAVLGGSAVTAALTGGGASAAGTASVAIAANVAGTYVGVLTTSFDTVNFTFTTVGRVASMTLTPATQSTSVSGNGSLSVTLKDAAGNNTQPLTVDTVSISASGGAASAVTVIGSGSTSLYDGVAAVSYTAPGTAGSYTVTATPGGTLPSGGVTAQNATVTVAGSISTTALTSIGVSAPSSVSGGTNPSAATAAISSGTASVTVAVAGTASTVVRLAAFASTGSGTINGAVAGSSLGTATTLVDVPISAAGVGSTTFTLGGNLLNTSSALRINQVQADNTTQVAGVQLTATQTAPAVSAGTVVVAPTGNIVAALGATTSVVVTVNDQFGTPIPNAAVRAFRTSTSGTLLSSAVTGSSGQANVSVSGAAGLTTGQSETYVFQATPLAGTPVEATQTLAVTYTTSGNVSSISVAVAGGATTPVLNTTTSIATIPFVLVPYGGTVTTAATGIYTVATGAGTAAGQYATFTPTTSPANTVTVAVPAGVKAATSLTSLTWTGGAQSVTVPSGTAVYVFATKTGTHDVTFTSGGVTTTAKLRAATVPAAAYNIGLTPSTQKLEAAGFGTVRVSVTDVFGNGVPAATGTSTGGVTLNVTGEVLFGGLTNTVNVTTNDAGIAEVTLIAGRAGAAAITATPQGGSSNTTTAWVAGYTPPTGAPAPVTSAAASVTVADISARSITITGTRTTVSGKPGIEVDGVTVGFENGKTVVPYFRFPGETSYTEGSARPVITDGAFMWQRKTGKKFYAYVTSDDGAVQSNRVIIPAA